MEPIRLPFPSLQYLAGHAVGRCLVLMKVDKAYWYTNRKDSLRECELKVDKLPLPPPPREYVRNVVRGFFEHVKKWTFKHNNQGADIFLDAHGNLDETRMAQHEFEKRYKDEFYRKDFQRFARFLEYFFWYHPKCCNNDFVRIILDLQKVNATTLEGPEYRIVYHELQVVFRFVNHRRVTRRSVPPEFIALLKFDAFPLTISMEQKDVLITYLVHNLYYNEDMFRIHVDLLHLSQRLKFIKDVLKENMEDGWIQTVICLLNDLDPEMRRNCLLGLNDKFATISFLECCLIPGYESLFMPMMKLLELNLDNWAYFSLFISLVNKLHLIGFDSLLMHFWQLLPESKRNQFRISILERHDYDWFNKLMGAMNTLSQANRALFQVVFDYVSVGLPQEQTSSLFHEILEY